MSVFDFKEYSAAFIDKQNSLAHHGIKGMHWGIRRYQNVDGSLTAAGRDHYGVKSKNSKEESATAAYLALLAGIYITPLAIAGTGAAIDTIKQNSKEKKLFKEENNVNKLTRKGLKNVNPNFGKEGYTSNCSKCSVVTELVSRGIDDYQVGKGSGLLRGVHTKFFTGAKETKLDVTNKTNLTKKFDKMPVGASGSYGFTYSGGMSGHSIHWSKLKDGTIRFEDGQTGHCYNMDDFIDTYKPGEMYSSSIIRMDNAKPNYKMMEKYEVLEKRKGK